MFKDALRELLTFLKNPQEKISNPPSQLAPLSLLIASYLLFLIPVFASTGFLSLAEKFGVFEPNDHAIMKMLDQIPAIGVLAFAVVFAPIAEETIFRLPLRWPRAYLFRILLFPIYITGPNSLQGTKASIHQWWNRNYRFIFYGVAIAFGLIHATNFLSSGSSSQMLLWAPLLVLPQVLLGVLLGFIRLRLGFWWAILTHALHNFIFMGMALLMLS